MEARPPNIEGRGQVTIRDLVQELAAHAARPHRRRRVPCRRGARHAAGHEHRPRRLDHHGPRQQPARHARPSRDACRSWPASTCRCGPSVSRWPRPSTCIVHLTRLRDGTRRITHITEVQGMEGDVITLQDIFLFDFGMGVDEHGRFRGHLKATGVRPEVRREARRPRHPPRPRGLPARSVRPQGGRLTMTLVNVRRHLRLVVTVCIAMALLFVVAPPPAGVQTGTSLEARRDRQHRRHQRACRVPLQRRQQRRERPGGHRERQAR